MTQTDGQSIRTYILEQAERVENRLAEAFPAHWPIPASLRASMQYSLRAGGKRIRPIIALAAAESCEGDSEAALPIACALELVHTYSLVHDDLPAMDNDDFRRGVPTNHRVYGEAMAILAGDGLLTHAFYMIAEAGLAGLIPQERALRIVGELAEYAGPRGMVGGQAADMLGEQGVTSLADLDFIHLHKTSDLIVCSLRAGGHAAQASEAELAALTTFGTCIGLAFQILDDMLDVTGNEQKLGKKTQADVKEHKVTYPYLLGLDACAAKVTALTEQGKEAVRSGAIARPERLLGLADFLMRRDH